MTSARSDQGCDRAYEDLLFSVRRSVRYHHRRQRFFDRLSKLGSLLSALAGSATVASVLADLGPAWVTTLAAATAVFGAFELVVGTAKAARLHGDFAREFIALERDLVLAGPSPSDATIRQIHARRLDIEANEPPPLKVLDAMCHNELARALGYPREALADISPLQRVLAQFFDYHEADIEDPAWRQPTP